MFMTSQHKTGTHPFYIGMYIHIYTHIYVHIYTSQKECLCIFWGINGEGVRDAARCARRVARFGGVGENEVGARREGCLVAPQRLLTRARVEEEEDWDRNQYWVFEGRRRSILPASAGIGQK